MDKLSILVYAVNVNMISTCRRTHKKNSKPRSININDVSDIYPLSNHACFAVKSKCAKNSGVCRLMASNSNYHLNAGISNQKLSYNKVVSLKYTGGEICPRCKCQRQTVINFVCAPEEVTGKPVFMSQIEDCTYVFVWRTKHVCEKEVSLSWNPRLVLLNRLICYDNAVFGRGLTLNIANSWKLIFLVSVIWKLIITVNMFVKRRWVYHETPVWFHYIVWYSMAMLYLAGVHTEHSK